MKFRNYEGDSQEDSFQIAPFIDIVFLLLIFFLLTARLEAEEKNLGLTLPSASKGEKKIREKNEIIINIDSNGIITVRDDVWETGPKAGKRSLTAMLTSSVEDNKTQSVIIRADAKTAHKFVVDVLNACREAKIARVDIATLQKYADK